MMLKIAVDYERLAKRAVERKPIRQQDGELPVGQSA